MPTIPELRASRGMTQLQLANAVGVTPSAVFGWEAGRSVPKVPQLRKIAEVFGVKMDDVQLLPRREPRQQRMPST